MELKLLADVALVGYPNAGKSTLISQCTAAKPKIAGYPFTTLVPNLGVRRGQSMDYVIADVPGIIEGASDGKGLGIRFLKHIERSRVLIIMLDLDPHTGRKLDMELECLLTEMRKFSAELSERPKFIFINKADAFAAELENTDEDFLKERAYPELQTLIKKLSDTEKLHPNCLYISAVSGQGVKDALALVENELVKLGGEIKRENTLAGDFVWGNRELL